MYYREWLFSEYGVPSTQAMILALAVKALGIAQVTELVIKKA
jgi:hypothetical protein